VDDIAKRVEKNPIGDVQYIVSSASLQSNKQTKDAIPRHYDAGQESECNVSNAKPEDRVRSFKQ